MRRLALLTALALSACATTSPASPQDAFWANLNAHCGKAFPGTLASDEAVDADFKGRPLMMHVRHCSANEIRIPFHVGPKDAGGEWDRSRTWVITRTATGLRLKHDHRHEDGSEDRLTQYGGDTASPGSATVQAFPVDAESIALFRREGRDVSVTNVWEVEISEKGAATPRFAYVLRRTGANARHFRVEFDLATTLVAPPPWGG
ncbi:MAG: hypothetical protein IPG54_04765 [Sphingomonadales bacterium]|jgi:hypothetical protein|nr:hypothetical protein [Sphingomonadales bacterium]MBK9002921.1 hypothetical protein [Sphingomonadales bacterium]MBK9268169.1 hypothetical protein [Sphingomonadales bacterium]MBP6434280.1 hypothetical protein [Sphingorhabdus sp.]